MKVQFYLILTLCLLRIQGYSQNTRPNILLIVADDLGYTNIGAFGGEIATPVLDKIAAQSRLYSNFHTMPTCAPTRSILLTGSDNHLIGLGTQHTGFIKKNKGIPGYEGYLNHRVTTLPEVLQPEGYRTYMSGKWHLGHEDEQAPSKRGFHETFALMPGGASHYSDQRPLHPGEPAVYRRNGQVLKELPTDFYSTKNYTDSLLSWMERDKNANQPFFAYLAYTAPHDPLQAPKSYIDKYKGKYDEGYEVFRKRRFEALKEKGLISSTQSLPPWSNLIPRWTNLSETRKQEINRDMETYAAMIDYLDEQIGRVYDWLVANNALDNTLIIFMSDNGISGMNSTKLYPTHTAEYHSQFNNELANRGKVNSFTNINAGWAVATAAVYRDFKAFTTEGGIRTPMFIKPVKIVGDTLKVSPTFFSTVADKKVCATFTHVRDLMPTILETANVTHPSTTNSKLIRMLGKSLAPLIINPTIDLHKGEGIGFELHGSKGYIKDGWKILQSPIPFGSGEWELYNLAEEVSEQNNLIFSHPNKFQEMLTAYENYEKEMGVIDALPGPLALARNIFNIIFWLLIAVFGLAILGKLSGKLTAKYTNWGYGAKFMYALAAAELMVIGGLFTIYHQYAAWFLVAIMSGAFFTLINHKENWKAYLLPLFTSILLGLYLLLKSGYLLVTLL